MREIYVGTKKHTVVVNPIESLVSGSQHVYQVIKAGVDMLKNKDVFAEILFQKGPVKEVGVNGIHNEDLIAVVIDRLEGFQSGDYRCRENAIAITKLEEAMLWLGKRTMDREARGVEGTSTK